MRVLPLDNVILETRGLTKEFRGFTAVQGVGLQIRRGTIHALIGPNGAGKTTFFNLVTGVLASDAGRIVFEGSDLNETRPSRRTLRGVARTFQNIRLFSGMTAFENMLVAQHNMLMVASGYTFLGVFAPHIYGRRRTVSSLVTQFPAATRKLKRPSTASLSIARRQKS